MKAKPYILSLLISFVAIACSKSGADLATPVTGNWVFRQQTVVGYAYPAILAGQNYQLSASDFTMSSNDINVIFSGNGSFTFNRPSMLADNGTYTIAQDSFLIIKPDTSNFIKFSYPDYEGINSSTTLPNQPQPPALYTGFYFVSDTILFHKPDANSLVLTTGWVSKYTGSLPSGDDTLQFAVANSYFVKQ